MTLRYLAIATLALACATSPAWATASATTPAETSGGNLAALDSRIGKPMFEAAQDVASAHQCERMLRVRSVDGDNAHFFSRCDSGGAPIEILCNATSCHEGPPQG